MSSGNSTSVRPADKVQIRQATLSGSKRLNITIKVICALIASIFSLSPIFYVVAASFNKTNSLTELVPSVPTLDNYATLNSEQYPILLWLFNSVKVAGITTILTLVLTTMAAYAFSRMRFSGRRQGLLLILLIQTFPNFLALVSLYLLLLQIKDLIPWLGLNSHGGLILAYLGGALGVNTWLIKGFFDTIPKELDESASIDGASKAQIFIQVLLPLLRPILAVMAILVFIGTYGDFLLAAVLLSGKENYTLAVGLNLLINEQRSKNWGQFCAAALVGALPIVIVFLAMQRNLVGGLTSGAVKG